MVIVRWQRCSYGLKTRYECSGEPSDMGLIGRRSLSNCSARNSSCTRRRSWYKGEISSSSSEDSSKYAGVARTQQVK